MELYRFVIYQNDQTGESACSELRSQLQAEGITWSESQSEWRDCERTVEDPSLPNGWDTELDAVSTRSILVPEESLLQARKILIDLGLK